VTEASCPSCGEPVERRQLVCLNCGGRVALRERTPLAREPVTAVAAVLLAVIVIGAGLFGFAISELTSTTPEPAREGPAVVSGDEQAGRTAEKAPPTEATPTETAPR
jgi:DNA-directed RNA polymerase subunit RPC12/RpoP